MIKEFKDDYGFLSNFYMDAGGGFMTGATFWQTNEHFFQAMKTEHPIHRDMIRNAAWPAIAKKMGSKRGYYENGLLILKIDLRPDWEEIKLKVMLFGLRKKFFPGSIMAQKLMETYPKKLVEGNYWHDNYWGDCYCPKCQNIQGKNMLGELLMIVRDELLTGTAEVDSELKPPYKDCTCEFCTALRNGSGYTKDYCRDIEPQLATVWLVKFGDGETQLCVWHKDAEITEICHSVSTHNPGRTFKVSSVDVGEFKISEVINSYHSDGRSLNNIGETEL